jgi:hypothetical protein
MVVEIGCEDLLQKPLTRSTLRIVLDRVKTIPTTSSAISALQNSSPPLAGRHLLYAEDSLPSQKIVTRMLVNAGARCSVVENGAAAVEAALNNPSMFDCILMVGYITGEADAQVFLCIDTTAHAACTK